MTVRDFPVTGLVIFGGQGTRVEDNELAGGHAYGLLASVSTGTVVSGNRVNGGGSAGIYIGASPQAQARVFGNRVTGAGLFGIYIRNASHGTVAGNTVEAACMGVGFIATAPARDTISDWNASGNLVRRNNRLCQAGSALTGTGILLGGTDRITIAHNVVHDNAVPPGTNAPWGGGIVLVNGRLFGGPAESADTRITGNLLYGNKPFDIAVLGPSERTLIAHNICASSSPADLCR
jgi:parallel beta-helix repeat protein